MKNVIKTATVALVIMLLSSVLVMAQEHNHTHKGDKSMEKSKTMDMKSIDKNNDGVVYECPMKCEAPSDKPGECSKCGMSLKKVSVKDATSGSMNKGMKMDHGKMMNHDKNGKHMDMDHSKMDNHLLHKGTIDVSKIDKNKDGKVFQDMMDWNVISDKAGDCPICGMTLKEVTVEQAVKNLNKHGFKTK